MRPAALPVEVRPSLGFALKKIFPTPTVSLSTNPAAGSGNDRSGCPFCSMSKLTSQ